MNKWANSLSSTLHGFFLKAFSLLREKQNCKKMLKLEIIRAILALTCCLTLGDLRAGCSSDLTSSANFIYFQLLSVYWKSRNEIYLGLSSKTFCQRKNGQNNPSNVKSNFRNFHRRNRKCFGKVHHFVFIFCFPIYGFFCSFFGFLFLAFHWKVSRAWISMI